jgi:hypothetical protein
MYQTFFVCTRMRMGKRERYILPCAMFTPDGHGVGAPTQEPGTFRRFVLVRCTSFRDADPTLSCEWGEARTGLFRQLSLRPQVSEDTPSARNRLAAGTHPLALPKQQPPTRKARYEKATGPPSDHPAARDLRS